MSKLKQTDSVQCFDRETTNMFITVLTIHYHPWKKENLEKQTFGKWNALSEEINTTYRSKTKITVLQNFVVKNWFSINSYTAYET